MLEQYLGILEDTADRILDEFFDGVPTTFVEADFEVQIMKNEIALKNGHVSMHEHEVLNTEVVMLFKLWKKLNDVD